MLIDWFTVGAQALNFLILVGMLKHFLYRPILQAIDAREKLIATELADAAAKKAEAQKERDEFQHKNEEFDRQRAVLLSKATEEAKAERQRLLDEAQKAADALSAKRQETLRNDAHNLNQAISRRTQQEVFAIARKALTDLATTSLEERLGEVFTRRLREMGGQAKEGLAKALKTAADPALVRSAFDLPATQRAAIQNALNETFSADIHLRFETSPDLVSGIELTSNGQKVAWSIADFLSSLEEGVNELLKEKDKPLPKIEHKPEVKTEPKPEAKAETKVDAVTPAKSEVKAESKPELKGGSKPEETTAPKPDESKVEPKSEDKTELPTVAKAVPEPTIAPAPKAEAKPEPETVAMLQPEPAVKIEDDSKTKTEPKLAEPKPETKSA